MISRTLVCVDDAAEEQTAAREAAQAAAASGEATAVDSTPPLPKPIRGRATGASNPFQSSVVSSGPQAEWEELVSKPTRDEAFYQLEGSDSGKVAGGVAYAYLMETGLNQDQLRRIWDISDIDDDGALDADEFAVCMYFVEKAKAGEPIPSTLPEDVMPPSKRRKT